VGVNYLGDLQLCGCAFFLALMFWGVGLRSAEFSPNRLPFPLRLSHGVLMVLQPLGTLHAISKSTASDVYLACVVLGSVPLPYDGAEFS
jgi:hypothetical protein